MVMDPIKQEQELEATTNAKGVAIPLKIAALQFLLLASIILFLLSYHQICTTSLLQSLHQFMGRKTMFLICNVILLFLARDSGLLGSARSLDDLYDEFILRRGDSLRAATRTDPIKIEIEIESNVDLEEKGGVESDGYLELVVVGGDGGERKGVEELEVVGVEELNKRCEEFIERVKRERRLEEYLQVVMV